MSVTIIDTGCANLASVGFAFARLGAAYQITKDPEQIASAERVILPGVGAAPYAMAALRKRGLIDVIKNLQQPVMGICLGMQLLFSGSEEGAAAGLGMLSGKITAMNAPGLRVPHMGWNRLEITSDDPILHGIDNGAYAYFVHSYAAAMPQGDCIAACKYGDPFAAIVRRANIYGCQFHPERSAKTGARILQNFLKVRA